MPKIQLKGEGKKKSRGKSKFYPFFFFLPFIRFFRSFVPKLINISLKVETYFPPSLYKYILLREKKLNRIKRESESKKRKNYENESSSWSKR